MSADFKQLEQLAKRLEKAARTQNLDEFYKKCTKEIALRLYRKLLQRTPVAVDRFETVTDDSGNKVTYKRGAKKGQVKQHKVYKGGTLRRNWTMSEVIKNGNIYSVQIINDTEYASYVNYGHRQTPGRFVPAIGKRLKSSWVDGKFMLEISEEELERALPSILNRKLDEYLKEVFNSD